MVLGKHFEFSNSHGYWIATVRFDDRGVLKVWRSPAICGSGMPAVCTDRWVVGWDDYTLCIGGETCQFMQVAVEEEKKVVTRRGGAQQPNGSAAATETTHVVLRQSRPEGEDGKEGQAKNQAAAASEWGDGREVAGPPAVHEGKTCVVTGASPIVGPLYELVGAETPQAICARAFRERLTPSEQALFACTARPGEAPSHEAAPLVGGLAVHEGVRCDVTGEHPIIGVRYHQMGTDFDVCERGWQQMKGTPQREMSRWLKLTRARMAPGADTMGQQEEQIRMQMQMQMQRAPVVAPPVQPQQRPHDAPHRVDSVTYACQVLKAL